MKPIRIIVVEDDAFTRATMKAALQLQGIEVIHDTSNVTSAMKIARTARPEAAVIDLDLGKGPNGIDLAVGLRNAIPEIGIVLLTGFVDPRLLDPEIGKLPKGSKYLIKQKISNIEVVYDAILDSIASIKEGWISKRCTNSNIRFTFSTVRNTSFNCAWLPK